MASTEFLAPARFIDSDAPDVAAFARDAAAGARDPLDRALRVFYAVRDGIRYDPYLDLGDPANFRASAVLAAGLRFCIRHSALLPGCVRRRRVPARARS